MTLSEKLDLGVYRLVSEATGGAWHETRIPEVKTYLQSIEGITEIPDLDLVDSLLRLWDERYVALQAYSPVSGVPHNCESTEDRTFFDRGFQIRIEPKGRPYFERLDEHAKSEPASIQPVSTEDPLVFVSCGQYSESERRLGTAIAQLIEEQTPCRAYFADNQSSLDGLSRHIFGALDRCIGLIAVMHPRGQVETLHGTHTRGSVWIEQEVAIAAFLNQAQGRQIDVAVYIHRDIKREGVREQLMLNPKDFLTDEEILSSLREDIGHGKFSEPEAVTTVNLTASMTPRMVSHDSNQHQYNLLVELKNQGTTQIDNYWVELHFPKVVLPSPPTTIVGELTDRASSTHRLFRKTNRDLRPILYPGDSTAAMQLPYHMNDGLLENSELMEAQVYLDIFSEGMRPRRITKPFKELQNF